jgi:alpha-1,3-rhamnosyl/mannosyltransferase
MRVLTRQAIRQAERVIALSDFTRQELKRFEPSVLAKTVVVYPGVGAEFSAQAGADDTDIIQHYGLTPGYIMALGNIHPRKNLARLLEAYMALRRRCPSAPAMVWGGLQRWDSAELVCNARSAGIVLPGFIAQEHLPAIYRNAAMLVYPSLYEGFGLPPLEAMASGTPVVTGNVASLPEAVGDAGLMVDPTDSAAIADAMARILSDVSLIGRLREAGLERVQQFTWKENARRLLASLSPAART